MWVWEVDEFSADHSSDSHTLSSEPCEGGGVAKALGLAKVRQWPLLHGNSVPRLWLVRVHFALGPCLKSAELQEAEKVGSSTDCRCSRPHVYQALGPVPAFLGQARSGTMTVTLCLLIVHSSGRTPGRCRLPTRESVLLTS